MTTITDWTIDTPGLYPDLPEDIYHRDPVPYGSLSNSGAKTLLPPSCPAIFKYEREHGRTPTRSMEFGTSAHTILLGSGPKLVRVEADSWRTNKAKEAAAEARAEGAVPLLTADYERCHEMARVLRADPLAGALFDPDQGGFAEQSLFWIDDRTGIWRRCRIDWLRDWNRPGRLYLVDYKTISGRADNDSVAKACARYGYHMQDPWYRDAAIALGLSDNPAFLFAFQETTPPFLVNVVELDSYAKRAGRERITRAIDTYVRCTEAGHWPGYSESGEIQYLSLPKWAFYE